MPTQTPTQPQKIPLIEAAVRSDCGSGFHPDDFGFDGSLPEPPISEKAIPSSIDVSISPEGGLRTVKKFSPIRATTFTFRQELLKKQVRVLAERLCEEHPAISTDAEVLGGTPHIRNTRLSVGTILAKLYLHGSTEVVANIYEPHLNEEQVKEAIAYAQDFLEIACATEKP